MPILSVNPYITKSGVSNHKVGTNPPTSVPAFTFRNKLFRQWTNTPNYFTKKKQGLPLDQNTYYFALSELGILNGHCTVVDSLNNFVESTSGVCIGTYTHPGYVPTVTTFETSGAQAIVLSRLEAKLLAKIKGQKVNLAQMFAERKQTAELLTSTAKTLAKTLLQLKKFNFVGAVRTLTGGSPSLRQIRRWDQTRHQSPARRVSNGWLQLQYGWIPLLSDVHESAELCAQSLNVPIKSKVSVGLSADDQTKFKYSAGLSNNMLLEEKYYFDIRAKSSIWFEIDSQAARSMSQLGISNPEALAWELLPFSFVVDWAYPIGNFLSSIDATAGLRLTNRNFSFWSKHWCDFSVTSGGNAGYQYDCAMEARTQILEVGRSNLSGWPANRLPELKNPYSTTHMFNALALLAQVFKL